MLRFRIEISVLLFNKSASGALNSGASSSLFNSASPCGVCRGLPGCNSLFFASPKKSKQKKGDPQSGPRRGSLKKLEEPENLETCPLRVLRTSKFFNPSPPTFSSPARTGLGSAIGFGFGFGFGIGEKASAKRLLATPSPHLPDPQTPIPSVCAEERRIRRIKILDVRRRLAD